MIANSPPQRFTQNNARYVQRGGLVKYQEDASFFADKDALNPADSSRFDFLCLALDQIHRDGITGDFLELGVYKGQTAVLFARFAERLNRGLYLMDTFSGWDQRDLVGLDQNMPKVFGDTSMDFVANKIRMAGVDVAKRVRFIKGRFPDTSNQIPASHRFALVHLDADLQAPTLAGLKFFYPRVNPGGFIIIHDYLSLHFDGLQTAVDEFRRTIPEGIVPVPDASGTVVIRKNSR